MSRAGRRTGIALAVLVALLVGLWWSAPRTVALAQEVEVDFGEGATVAVLPDLGDRGAYALRYEDGEYARLSFPVRNRGPVPIRLAGVRLADEVRPMVEHLATDAATGRLPVELSVGEETTVTLTVRFENCEFYTERAMGVFGGAAVDVEVLGRRAARQVRFASDLVVRSPMMVTCPERVRDRDAQQRRHVAG